MSLTDSQIRQAKPKDKASRTSDAKSLYLELTPTGSKCWKLEKQPRC